MIWYEAMMCPTNLRLDMGDVDRVCLAQVFCWQIPHCNHREEALQRHWQQLPRVRFYCIHEQCRPCCRGRNPQTASWTGYRSQWGSGQVAGSAVHCSWYWAMSTMMWWDLPCPLDDLVGSDVEGGHHPALLQATEQHKHGYCFADELEEVEREAVVDMLIWCLWVASV